MELRHVTVCGTVGKVLANDVVYRKIAEVVFDGKYSRIRIDGKANRTLFW